jgi:hypothetical protein
MKKLEICNNYEVMSPEERMAAIKDFNGLSEEALKTLNEVAKIFVKYYTTRQGITSAVEKRKCVQ